MTASVSSLSQVRSIGPRDRERAELRDAAVRRDLEHADLVVRAVAARVAGRDVLAVRADGNLVSVQPAQGSFRFGRVP